MMSIKDASIWDLLDEYADIRDELEDTLRSYEILQYELTSAMEDIQDELDILKEHLSKCSSRLIRFKGPKYQQNGNNKMPYELPFDSET